MTGADSLNYDVILSRALRKRYSMLHLTSIHDIKGLDDPLMGMLIIQAHADAHKLDANEFFAAYCDWALQIPTKQLNMALAAVLARPTRFKTMAKWVEAFEEEAQVLASRGIRLSSCRADMNGGTAFCVEWNIFRECFDRKEHEAHPEYHHRCIRDGGDHRLIDCPNFAEQAKKRMELQNKRYHEWPNSKKNKGHSGGNGNSNSGSGGKKFYSKKSKKQNQGN